MSIRWKVKPSKNIAPTLNDPNKTNNECPLVFLFMYRRGFK